MIGMGASSTVIALPLAVSVRWLVAIAICITSIVAGLFAWRRRALATLTFPYRDFLQLNEP